MNIIKIILAIVALYLLLTLGFAVVGIVYTAIWYLFLLGIVAVGGAVGYKLLKKNDERAKLEEKTPITIAEVKNADRILEEYKRKSLSE
jgi:uncharacterized membrane protein YbhN (UPF0104 family)